MRSLFDILQPGRPSLCFVWRDNFQGFARWSSSPVVDKFDYRLFPAIALGSQPTDVSTKQQAPKKRYASILDASLSPLSVAHSLLLTILSIVAFAIGGQTLCFATLSLCQIVIALTVSSNRSVIHLDFLRNKNLYTTAIICAAFVLIVTVTPLASAFALKAMSFVQFLFLIIFAAIVFGTGELFKFLKPKFIND
jgi:magnesium-transporting ATPase (P-type)